MLAEEGDTLTLSNSLGGAIEPRATSEPDFWVFAYGSLIWNPGFAYKSREPAKLVGYRRGYCIRSQIYRGTPEAPGLVLGLERGGECEGVVYLVAGELKSATMVYLRARELVTNVYDETLVAVETRDGRRHLATTYVANPAHEQYVAPKDFGAAIETMACAAGSAGPNAEYAINAWTHLAEFGIRDGLVERFAEALCARLRREG